MQHDNGNPPGKLNTTVTLSNSVFPDVEGLPDPWEEEKPLSDEFLSSALDRTFDLGNWQQKHIYSSCESTFNI